MSLACERRWITAGRALSIGRQFRAACKLALLTVILLSAVGMPAQSQSELRIKAAYVFNLTKYVEWPALGSQVVIGVVGDGPMLGALRELSGKTSDSRQVVVVTAATDADLKRCDLVYVTYSGGKKIQDVLARFSGQSVLTVGDAASFAREGGMVTLLTVGDHIEIQINLQTCHQAKLKISSRLLSLAKIVTSNEGTG